MTNLAEHPIPAPSPRRAVQRRSPAARPAQCRDSRWPMVAAALARLRAARRHSVRIVDADCGDGALLLCAVRHARALGFTAIEARGIGDDPGLIACAKAAAVLLCDPAIGIAFETGDPGCALCSEAEFPADILLWHRCSACNEAVTPMLAAAGQVLIADQPGMAGAAA